MSEEPQKNEPTDDGSILVTDSTSVPTLSLAFYLDASIRTVAGAQGAIALRMLRGLAAFGMGLTPIFVVATALWYGNLTDVERAAWYEQSQQSADIFELFGLDSSGRSVALFCGVMLLGLVARAWFDARYFARLRARFGVRPPRSGSLAGAFFGVHLIQLALGLCAVLFTSPLVVVLVRMSSEPAAPGRAAFVTGVILAVFIALGYLRYLLVVMSAQMAWRPKFFAGSFVAGLSAPLRTPSFHGRLALFWLAGAILLSLAGGAAAVPIVEGAVSGALNQLSPSLYLGLAAFVGIGFAFGMWIDATLVAQIGHQLGELSREALDQPQPAPASAKPAGSVVSAPLAIRSAQERLEPPVEGIYVPGSEAARLGEPTSVVSYEDVLGYRPSAVAAEEWTIPVRDVTDAAFDQVATTAGGATEVWLELPDPTVVSQPGRIAPDVEAPAVQTAGDVEGFERLRPGLRPANHRTAAGATERVWRP